MMYSKEWLKESELKAILEFQDISEKYDTWIMLMYYPALRISEAINVRVKDLNFDNRCIDVWGGKGKDITELQKAPCKVQVLKRIKRYCDHNDLRPNDYIMFSQKGEQVTRSWVYRVVNNLCDKAGIDKRIGTHTFRRSRAEHLLDRGLELAYVSKYLRHKNLSTTMRYLDLSIEDVNRRLDAINDINLI